MKPILALFALAGLLADIARADRSVSLVWDAQTDAKFFTLYSNGGQVATATGNTLTVMLPDTAVTLTLTASNDGGESLPSTPLTPRG